MYNKLSIASVLLILVISFNVNAQEVGVTDSQTLLASLKSPQEIRQHLADYLFEAARIGDDNIIREFAASHYDLNVRDEKGYTALILAAYHGHSSTVDLLIKNKADPCAKDNNGNTALMGALFKGELSIARKLATTDCDPDLRNNAGQTAAMYAALFGRLEILQQLKERGANINVKDVKGNSVTSLMAK